MFKKAIPVILLAAFSFCTAGYSQITDGSPYTPGKDANIDMFMNSWQDSKPFTTHGTLVERDILTKGDSMNPPVKGATLKYINGFTYAELAAKTSTTPTTLKGAQEIYYILSGKGVMDAGKKEKQDLYRGIVILMPADKTFTITNTGDEPLTMYLISEPTTPGFKPVKKMVVKDENTMPIVSTNGHWCHIVKDIFSPKDGLSTLYAVLTVGVDPMTITHPHSHNTDFEEVWTGLEGTSIAFLGKQIRMQPPGTAYMIPPDDKTAHSNINRTEKPVKLLYFSTRFDLPRK